MGLLNHAGMDEMVGYHKRTDSNLTHTKRGSMERLGSMLKSIPVYVDLSPSCYIPTS